MAFDIEGARKAGYSDDEIIDHLSTQQKDFDVQGARSAGYSASEILEHLTKENKSKSILPEGKGNYLQMMGAIPETMIRGVAGLGGQIWGGLAGAAEGMFTDKPVFENAAKVAQETSKALTPDKTLFAPTEFLEKDVLHPAIEWARGKSGEGLETLNRTGGPFFPGQVIKAIAPNLGMSDEAARTIGEVGFDVGMGAEMIRGPGRRWERNQERRAAEQAEQARLIQEASEPQYIKASPMQEPLEFVTREQTRPGLEEGTRPTGNQEPLKYTQEEIPRSIPPEELAIDAQTPRSPFDVQRTPAQLEKLNQMGIARDPNQPFFGDNRAGMLRDLPSREEVARALEQQQQARTTPFEFDTGALDAIQRSRAQKPIPYKEVPFERQLGPNDPLPYTRESIPDPNTRPTEFLNLREESPIQTRPYEPVYPRDGILRGMESNLDRQKASMERMRIDQDRLIQEVRDGKISEAKARKEVTTLNNRMEKLQKTIDRLSTNIETRKSAKNPTLGRGPGRRQGGYIDPSIIKEGVTNLIKKLGSGGAVRKFAGAYHPQKLISALRNTEDARSRETLVWMKPDDFLKVAAKRGTTQTETGVSNAKRRSIRQGFNTEEGLNDIPYLLTERNDKAKAYEVVGHEGRHRMDVFKEQGVDLVPVKLIDRTTRWGTPENQYGDGYKPYKALLDEEGKGLSIDFPQFVNEAWGIQASNSPLSSVPRSQRGMATTDLLTAGLSKLIRRNPKNEPKVQVPDPNKRQSLLDMASNKLDDWNEFWRKEGPTLKDIPDNAWAKGIEYFSNAQILYHDTQNPMVKWLADTIADEKSMATLKADYGTQGIQFDSKGLLPKKIVNPNSPYSHWLGLSQKERQLTTDIINKYSGTVEPTPDMMRAMGANQKVINALETLQQPIKEVLGDINKQLVALGRNPIKERPFYFMRNAGQGNWVIRVKNEAGESLGFHRVQTKGYGEHVAKSLAEKIKAENPDIGTLKTEVVPANARTGNNKYNVSTTLLEDIYQALEKSDPRREIITSAIADIKSKGGFGAHRAYRKGVQGMENTPKEFWKTYEKYIEDGYTYESGQRLANLRNQIEFTSDMPPGLKKWALEYIDRSRGGEPGEVIKALENGVDRVISTITGGLTNGRYQTTHGAFRDMVKNVNKGFITQALFFHKIPFLAASALQSTSFAPAIMSLYKNHGHTGSVMKSMLYGASEMFNKSPEFTKVIDYMSARGKIDQTLVHDMGFDFMKQAAQSESGKKAVTAFDWLVLGRGLPTKIEALNRVHAAAVGYHFLKDQMKGKELHAGVERFVDDVMGNYGLTDRPGVITRHGVVGDAIAPLGTFSNWYKGMTAVMLKEAAQGIVKGDMSKAVPFMHMWLSTALMAGVISAPLFKEIDWIWNQVKGLFGFNEKTPSMTEAVLTGGLPDTAKFGALTGLTTFVDPRGMHITGSMAAPEIMPGWIKSDGQINWKNAAPGLVWAGEAATGLMQLATDVVGLKKLSVEARRQALKDVFPSQFDAWFSNLDTTFNPDGLSMPQFKQGQPILSKTGQGTVRRNDDWDTYASLIGSGTIPEVTEKMVNRDIKREGKDLGGKRGELVQQAVDAIMYGTGDLDKITKQAMEIGYTNFDKAIQQAYQERLRTEAERSVGRGTTLQQYENHQYIKRAVGQ